MSRIVTPPSASAPRAASAARSTVSLSGCLPNLVMWMPRIQTSSLAIDAVSFLPRLEAEADRFGAAASVPTGSVASRTFMPSVTCSGSGVTLHRLRAHARAAAVDDRGDERAPAMPGAA